MSKTSKYFSNPSDENGIVHWSEEENRIWHDLVVRQLDVIEGRACKEYVEGLDRLDLPKDRIPQLHEVNQVLGETTGWEVVQVPALINFDEFFRLLSTKKFPVATFIRTRAEFDYLQEPDVFHEIFGHCPLLTNQAFANFTHVYGKLGYAANKEDRVFLARLYWFTVEFGLLNQDGELRIYGGGILSSPGETVYAIENTEVERFPMLPLDAIRTPYRIDIMQPIYFVLDKFEQLYDIANMGIMSLVEEAKNLGLYEPRFPPKPKKVS
jgi:phenylalanine-4-hydroxylase